jgi:hypothetical protein
MYVTIVEGAIDAAREDDLRSAWEDTTSGVLPDGFIESSLLRADDGTWRIVTVWESREAVVGDACVRRAARRDRDVRRSRVRTLGVDVDGRGSGQPDLRSTKLEPDSR